MRPKKCRSEPDESPENIPNIIDKKTTNTCLPR